MSDDLLLQELLERVWPEPPAVFDADYKVAPKERLLGNCLIEAGFQPVRVAQLDDDAFGLWGFRIKHEPGLDSLNAAGTLRKRRLVAICAAEIVPPGGRAD